ncbi:hypothetical protein CDL15_Pgr019169 [Punica granatum]|uniref:Uncharacterized protein n=1 Tax=Punica granatum TaxID=22663 RepID=A0A218WEM7_PUNGR|nr:hypothetical protein CDL15_Pgr019169 [Punica granatum]
MDWGADSLPLFSCVLGKRMQPKTMRSTPFGPDDCLNASLMAARPPVVDVSGCGSWHGNRGK